MSRTKQIARKTVGEKVYQKYPVQQRAIRRKSAPTNVEMEEKEKEKEKKEDDEE